MFRLIKFFVMINNEIYMNSNKNKYLYYRINRMNAKPDTILFVSEYVYK